MNGWAAGFVLLAIIGLTNIISKLIAHWELSSAVYVSQGMMAGAFMLLLVSRPGPLAIETLRHPNTWLYGWFFLLFNTLAIYVLRFIDVAALMQLQRFSTVLTFIVVWLFMNRRQNWRLGMVFQAVILAGVILMLTAVDSKTFGIVLVGTLLMCILQTMKAIVVETHTPNNKAKNFEQEVRVTAFVMAATGVLSYILLLSLSLANTVWHLGMAKEFIPEIRQFFSPYSLIFASIYGVFGFSAMRFLEFYTVKKIKSEGYMALMAFVPIFGLAFEYIGHFTGIVPMHNKHLSMVQISSLSLIVLGSLGSIWAMRKGKKTNAPSGKMGVQMERDRTLAQHALQYAQGDKARAAQLLGISKAILEVALYEKNPQRALTPKLSNMIQDNFTRNIAFLDGLTGLMNKNHFIAEATKVLEHGGHGTLFYLDLNKFKPINDTYGHDAGDEALKLSAARLRDAAGKKALVSRLGGDEFAVYVPSIATTTAARLSDKIVKKIAEPLELKQHGVKVEVGTSIGMAHFPHDGATVAKLMSVADKNMYRGKKSR